MHKVVRATGSLRLPKEATCSCGMETSKAICPKCHNELPHQFGMTDNLIVALIGAKEVGKSHYVTVLIHELKQRVGMRFHASMTALDEQTIKRYKADFKRHLYDNAQVVPATASARADIGVRYPLVYRLNVSKRNMLGGETSKPVSLTFFDTAGEDLTDIDTMTTVNRYIANADGIIFLLDPLQIPDVRDLVPSSVSLPSENTDQALIIERATRLIQNLRRQGWGRRRLKPGTRIDIPVAITFSKMDALKGIVDSRLLQASQHNGYLDVEDVEYVNDLFHSYVHKWMGPNISMFLKTHYHDYAFFGLSALGHSPDPSGRLPRGINPYRIEDPLLWILNKKRVISAKKST